MVLEPGRLGRLTQLSSWPVGRHPPARGATRDTPMGSQPHHTAGDARSLDSGPLPTHTRSCGSQPAHISLTARRVRSTPPTGHNIPPHRPAGGTPTRHLTGKPSISGVHPGWRLLAEPVGGLVAAVPPRRPCWTDLRLPRGDQPGHSSCDLPAQRPRSAVGVGPPSAVTTLPPTRPHLPNLRNVALGRAGPTSGRQSWWSARKACAEPPGSTWPQTSVVSRRSCPCCAGAPLLAVPRVAAA
jgi:hypothetical protein